MNRSIPLQHDLTEQLCNGSILVTATKRLAREFRQQFDLGQIDQGNAAWESAQILPFEAWIYTLWQQVRVSRSTHRESNAEAVKGADDHIILTPLQARMVWGKIVSNDIEKFADDTQPLWNIPATVKAAMTAWQISREWTISIYDCEKSFLPDHRGFARWARQFQKQCKDNNWIDKFELLNSIVDYIDQGNELDLPPLIWTGFDSFTAQQQSLIDSLRKIGASPSIHHTTSPVEATARYYREYDSEYSQWLAASQWARGKLQNNPNQRIAIVTPTLEKSRSMIDYALNQVLCPNHIANPGNSSEKPFHLSLGEKLADFPVIDSALLLLSLAVNKELPYSTISKTILCPFIAAADSESNPRSKLEYWCRRNLPYRMKLSDFLGTLEHSKSRPPTPVLLEKLISCCELLKSFENTKPFSHWSELMLTWLEQIGWPGEAALSSREFQTVDAFRQEISALRSLDLVTDPQSIASAFSVLGQRLQEKPFEPESSRVNVEVLGILESAGMSFDAIWFGGLTESDWPPPLQENPFVPHWLQLAAGYHRASVSLNAEHAEMQQIRLASQCDELVLSRHRFNEDVELLPSVLFGPDGDRIEPEPGLADYFHSHKPVMEIFADSSGIKLADDVTRGGAQVFQDQAACPFRAYARHRLGARGESVREPGLDARDRGLLIHGILEGIWASIKSSQSLESKSEVTLKNIVADNIERCSSRFFYISGSNVQLFRTQNECLEKLLMEWLEVEKSREQSFIVVALEKKLLLTLGQLTLSFKVDRIDQLGDGTLALIDYKTGTVGPIREWTGERPKSPQLPLYALAQLHNDDPKLQGSLSAIVFGQVRFGQSTYFGVCGDQPFQMVKHPANRVTALTDAPLDQELRSWPALIAHFNDQLTRLANAHYTGQAEVNPLDDATCKYCDLHGFCRIFEAGEIDG